MIAGFIADNLFFDRIDLWETQAVFAAYTLACFIAIPLLHALETRASRAAALGRGSPYARSRLVLPFLIQFALGGLWSGFVIFYGRSANLGASWPFLLFLVLVFIGNEYFYRYHSRLVFTSILFFFALYSYAIFAVPIYTESIGIETFLLSGAVAIGIFTLFIALLRWLARERLRNDVWRIRMGACTVLVLINASYFANILPPLPLSAESAGIYHEVWRASGAYLARNETGQPWRVRLLGLPPTLHVVSDESLFAYSSIFAPTRIATTIVHRWQRYDPAQEAWVTKATIAYPIIGGRDGGYRGYSTAPAYEDGEWRVSIETGEGRLITRLPFVVERVQAPPSQTTVTLQ